MKYELGNKSLGREVMTNLLFSPHCLLISPAAHKTITLTLTPIRFSSLIHACHRHLRPRPFSLLHLRRNGEPSPRAAFSSAVSASEGGVSVIDFEDFIDTDCSFLESDDSVSQDRIISAGEIGEGSRVLVSIGSVGFIDRVVESSPPNLLFLVHDSLLALASVKERHDSVRCWQGELTRVPETWTPFDVVFLYFLPALPFELAQVFETLSRRCSPGARLVITHHQGRQALDEQRKQYPNVVVSDLPEENALQSVAAAHSFKLVEFVDDSGFYLAVLKYQGAEKP